MTLGELVSGDKTDGQLLAAELERRGWIEEGEHTNPKGRPRDVWRVTTEGRRVAKGRPFDLPEDDDEGPFPSINPHTGGNEKPGEASVSSGHALSQYAHTGIHTGKPSPFQSPSTTRSTGNWGLGAGEDDLREGQANTLPPAPDLSRVAPHAPAAPAPAPSEEPDSNDLTEWLAALEAPRAGAAV